MKRIALACLVLMTVGSATIPALASTGNSQTSTNVSTVEGNHNTSNQSNRQRLNSRTGFNTGDTANIQDALNDSLVQGNSNRVNQRNEQQLRNRSIR